MFISCSAERKIVQIPEKGTAIIGSYWVPRLGLKLGPGLLQWNEGRITSIKTLKLLDHIPSNTLEWSSFTLMPGFIDAHVHLSLDSVDFYACLENWKNKGITEDKIQGFLLQYLERGITVIRDGGDINGFSWVAKKNVINHRWLGPEIISVHEAVHRKGKYGRFLGRGFEDINDWKGQKKDFFAQGLDQLKVVVTGLIRFDEYNVVGAPQWSVDELKAIVNDAHQNGKKVMAHASGTEGIQIALEAGVDSIEHGYYITSEQLQRMKEKNIAWIPTVAPIGNLLKYPAERYTNQEIEVLKLILEGHITKIKEAFRMNLVLGIGTDAGAYQVPHADSFYDELDWYNQAGIPMLEVYRLATETNAQICGLYNFGNVEIGTPMNQLQLNKI